MKKQFKILALLSITTITCVKLFSKLLRKKKQLLYIALGDSISEGYIANPQKDILSNGPYPQTIVKQLGDAWRIINFSKSNSTTQDIMNIVTNNITYIKNADLITISAGSNNLLHYMLKSIASCSSIQSNSATKCLSDFIEASIKDKTVLEKFKQELTSLSSEFLHKFRSDFSDFITELKAIAPPNALIFVNNIYNPFSSILLAINIKLNAISSPLIELTNKLQDNSTDWSKDKNTEIILDFLKDTFNITDDKKINYILNALKKDKKSQRQEIAIKKILTQVSSILSNINTISHDLNKGGKINSAIDDTIRQMNTVIDNLSHIGYTTVNVYDIFNNNKNLMQSDSLHPNELAHQSIATVFMDTFNNTLASN